MATSLLIGNGINRLNNAEASWEHVLRTLVATKPTVRELEFIKHKPFALIYEEILLSETKNKKFDEYDMKRRIADLVEGLVSNNFHRQVMKSHVRHVLTTNYDYNFERASGLPNVPKNLERETKYSVFRRRAVGDRFVWHIHGEAAVPNSITLGYDQYCGYVQKLRSHATANRTSEGGSPFKRGISNFDEGAASIYSWLDVFLRDDIHIVGLALDYTEIDLWWALTYKARLRARGLPVGKTYFHDWHLKQSDDPSRAKLSLLKALAVEVLAESCTSGFEPAYNIFVNTYLNNAQGSSA